MGWWQSLIDRWRRGPERRALTQEAAALTQRTAQLETQQLTELRGHHLNAERRARLLSDLIRRGLKARCQGECGRWVTEWEPLLAKLDGRDALVPVCNECQRLARVRAKRAQEAAALAAEATEASA